MWKRGPVHRYCSSCSSTQAGLVGPCANLEQPRILALNRLLCLLLQTMPRIRAWALVGALVFLGFCSSSCAHDEDPGRSALRGSSSLPRGQTKFDDDPVSPRDAWWVSRMSVMLVTVAMILWEFL
jgi:hypothetical protein